MIIFHFHACGLIALGMRLSGWMKLPRVGEDDPLLSACPFASPLMAVQRRADVSKFTSRKRRDCWSPSNQTGN
jgi:hypothetical protein